MHSIHRRFLELAILIVTAVLSSAGTLGQDSATGGIQGQVTLEDSERPVHGVVITILQLKRSIVTADDGTYEFKDVPPGMYDLLAHLDRVPDVVESVEVRAGSTADVPIQIRLRVVGEKVTVTASGDEETTINAVQPVTSIDSTELMERNTQSLGDALEHQLGVAKRTFGPGTSRPVVRGFDGDRVQVLEDGNQVGSLGYQSGDHAEPIDILSLEKVEVVKGPATLLYGSSSIGGVVNAITGHESSHPGTRGYVTGIGGSNNYQAGGSAGVEYGAEQWLLWISGGGQRANDYNTPIGRITNSYTRAGNGSGGFGFYPKQGFLSVDYALDKKRYGIPFDPEDEEPEVVFLNPRRQSVRVNAGFNDLDHAVSGSRFSLQYNDYRHSEISAATRDVNTSFANKTFTYRGVFDERRSRNGSGSFGFWGMHRDYTSSGAEALAPPTMQNAFALFAVQKIDAKRASLQFGGRFEHNGYDPSALPGRTAPRRSFNGLSAAVGGRVSLWTNGVFAVNYSHSYRAPSLEELYNEGPHVGNATFEIGDPGLKRERGDGIDLSVRHSSPRARVEMNYFFYRFSDFIFLAPTGNIEDGLIEANYAQDTTRYTGAEAGLDIALHTNWWLISKLDYVNAELTRSGTPLPRIPPLRGIIGLEANYKGVRFYPELVLSNRQDRLFPTEDRTAGFGLFNLTASYSIAQEHVMHLMSVNAYNLGDRLYRNHLSFIKHFAPEIGRGVRISYTVRFY